MTYIMAVCVGKLDTAVTCAMVGSAQATPFVLACKSMLPLQELTGYVRCLCLHVGTNGIRCMNIQHMRACDYGLTYWTT